jgi:hypothetical protein
MTPAARSFGREPLRPPLGVPGREAAPPHPALRVVKLKDEILPYFRL